MSKIKNICSLFQTTKCRLLNKIVYKSKYQIRTSKHMNQDMFKKMYQQNSKQHSDINNEKIDAKTQTVLQQYESEISLIKTSHQQNETQIKQKYLKILESLQFSSNDEIQKAQADRLNQLFSNAQLTNKRINNLSKKFKTKFVSQKKKYQLEYIKKYMLDNITTLKEQTQKQKQNKKTINKLKQQQNAFIPNDLVLKKLTFKTSDGKTKQILLAGVQQKQEQHCLYLKKLIQKFKIKNILSLMAPDLPMFIKTQQSFQTQWRSFLQRPSSNFKFYLNPNPKTLQDIKLTRQFIPQILSGMTKSRSFYETSYSVMQINQITQKYQHQPLLTGLKAGTVQNVYFGGYPFIKQRQMMALTLKLEDLRQILKEFTYSRLHKKQNFSAELLLPKQVVKTKFQHILKLARTICSLSDDSLVLLCEASIAQILSQEWKNQKIQYLSFDYNQNQYYLDLDINTKQSEVLFIQFIQKLVILDIILQPLIQNYFVRHQSFPYSCRNTVGGKENLSKVFLVWRHYYTLYSKATKGDFSKTDKS